MSTDTVPLIEKKNDDGSVHRKFTLSSFREQAKLVWTLAWPIALSGFLNSFPGQIHLAMLGHYKHNHENLAALNLASSFQTIVVTTFAVGFAGAIATIGGQAYGKKRFKIIGLILQRTIILLSIAFIPIAVLLWYSEPFFLLLKQDPIVAQVAGRYSRYSIISLWPGLNFQAVLIFLFCQGVVLIDLYINIFVNVCNGALSYFVIIYWDFGLDGIIALDIVNSWLYFFAIYFLAWWRGYFEKCLPPLSMEVFRNWSKIFLIAIPGALMVCTETWVFEILSFASGTYGPVQQVIYGLSSQMILTPIVVIAGFINALTTRVSNSLGASDPESARHASYTCFIICLGAVFVYALLLIGLAPYIARIFTSDPHIVPGLLETFPLIVAITVCSVVTQIIAGVLHASGRQTLGALANVIGYDIIALPVALVLAKYWDFRGAAFSLWAGVGCGVLSVLVVLAMIFAKLDWRQESLDAQKRVESQAEGENVDFLKEEHIDDVERGVQPPNSGDAPQSDNPYVPSSSSSLSNSQSPISDV